jgi:hypothetical protein
MDLDLGVDPAKEAFKKREKDKFIFKRAGSFDIFVNFSFITYLFSIIFILFYSFIELVIIHDFYLKYFYT